MSNVEYDLDFMQAWKAMTERYVVVEREDGTRFWAPRGNSMKFADDNKEVWVTHIVINTKYRDVTSEYPYYEEQARPRRERFLEQLAQP